MKILESLRSEVFEIIDTSGCISVVDDDGDRIFVNPRRTRAAFPVLGPGFIVIACYVVERGWFRIKFHNRGFLFRPKDLRAWLTDQPVELLQKDQCPFRTIDEVFERSRKTFVDQMERILTKK